MPNASDLCICNANASTYIVCTFFNLNEVHLGSCFMIMKTLFQIYFSGGKNII